MIFSLFRDGLEDPLDDLGMVSQQLEQLSVIGRCEYQKTCSLLVTLFDSNARLYQQLVSANPTTSQLDITIQEGTEHCSLVAVKLFFVLSRSARA